MKLILQLFEIFHCWTIGPKAQAAFTDNRKPLGKNTKNVMI